MGLFTYRALDKGGRGVKGILDADSLEQAKEVLRQKDVLVTSLKEASRGSIRLKMELILSFTRDLAGLLRSGLPLYESLLTIE